MSAEAPARPLRLVAERSVLVFLDMQERLLPVIHDDAAVRQRARLLAFGAQQCGVPIVGTEMNPTKLGPSVGQLPELCTTVMPKMTFGAVDSGLLDVIAGVAPQADQFVLAGTEAHVSVSQTALGLLEAGRQVWVVADACGSRDPRDYHAALKRVDHVGATIVTAEMAIFEWMRTCEHANFRNLSRHVKEPRFPSADV